MASNSKSLSYEELRTTILLTRPDIASLYSDHDSFYRWLITDGRKEYAALRSAGSDIWTEWSRESELALPTTKPALSRLMALVWRSRSDLQAVFDISKPDGQQHFVDWFYLQGTNELGLNDLISEGEIEFLVSINVEYTHDYRYPITQIMASCWRHRHDLHSTFDVDSKDGSRQFFYWYYSHGINEFSLYHLIGQVSRDALNRPAEGKHGIILLCDILLSSVPDSERVSLGNTDCLLSSGYWRERFPLLVHFMPADIEAPIVSAGKIADTPHAGVNLIGYARGEFGIGEDVRMAAAACKAAGIPFNIVNVRPGNEVTENDHSVDKK